MEEPAPANKITFQISPPTTKNKAPPNMIALKRIDNYSYALSDEIGLGLTSHVYKGRCDLTSKILLMQTKELLSRLSTSKQKFKKMSFNLNS